MSLNEAEWHVLDLLLTAERSWTIGALVGEIGSAVAVSEALETLQVAGLIERDGAFIRIAPS